VLWSSEKLIVACDAGDVWGVVVKRGLGQRRLVGAARAPLPPGALVPSARQRNLVHAAEVRDAMRAVRSQLGLGEKHHAHLILPAGVARPLLLDATAPESAVGSLSFRLAATLSCAPSEAVVGTMRVPPGRVLAAAVRRSIAAEYETIAEAAGLKPGRVELAPLVAFAGLLARPLPARTLDVVLGESAVSFARWEQNGVASLRTRLRSRVRDDIAWIAAEIDRAARIDGQATFAAVRLAGASALALADHLRTQGRETFLAWDLPHPPGGMEPAELAWLGGVLR
jgi:hypothetical protein